MITTDTNANSRFRDNIYVAWDITVPGNSAHGIRLAGSSDHGASFAIARVDTNNGAGKDFGAVPFVGPDGEVYAAWNDLGHNVIAFNCSFDGGTTWDQELAIASKTAVFVIPIPAESFRGADVYPLVMQIGPTDRTEGASIARGWTRERQETPTFFFRFLMTKAQVGLALGQPETNCPYWWTDGIIGCQSIPLRGTSTFLSTTPAMTQRGSATGLIPTSLVQPTAVPHGSRRMYE